MKNLAKTGYFICLFLILALFCYFRIKPIYFQTVPYTFDQGRDFLKAYEIVVDKQPALLGPTTGIPGVNHGVWWYYALTIPFILTGGNPLGFYYFVLFLGLSQVFLFSLFLRKEFGNISSLSFAALVTVAPYFTKTSIFAINSVLAPLALLSFLYCYYQYQKTKDLRLLFLVGFLLSMVFEAEVAFGLFLYPAFLLCILALRQFKDFFGNKKILSYFFAGLALPVLPRILFELKSGFSQTRLILKYFNETSVQTAKTYYQVFWERWHLLKDFWIQTFPGSDTVLPLATFMVIVLGVIFSSIHLKKKKKDFYHSTLILFIGLFLLSHLYKTVFWQNYFEGFPYFFILLASIGLSSFWQSKNLALRIITLVYLFIVFASLGVAFGNELQNKKPPKLEGLREHVEVTRLIFSDNAHDELCVKVYTPPIIPYTYRYLFSYYMLHGKPKIKEAFIHDTCYLILEKDECKFLPIEVAEMRACRARQDNWKSIHVPKGSRLLHVIRPNDHVRIEKWRGREVE